MKPCIKCNSTERTVTEHIWKDKSVHQKGTCTKCGYANWLPMQKKSAPNIEGYRKHLVSKYGDSFYTQEPWLRVRYKVLANYNRVCALCGSTEKPLHVDHIKPRSKFPELELDIANLQVLCWQCNKGKGNSDDQDFREVTV